MCSDKKNISKLRKEKGFYYPDILIKVFGCPVENGSLLPSTTLNYIYSSSITSIFSTVAVIGYQYNNKKDELYGRNRKTLLKNIDIDEFLFSLEYALADLFYGGCDPDNFDKDAYKKEIEDYIHKDDICVAKKT